MRTTLTPAAALALILTCATWAYADPCLHDEAVVSPAGETPALARILDLERAGGARATVELMALLQASVRPEIRLAALRALGRIGVRVEEVTAQVRRLAKIGPLAEREAAVLALGRVGDGRDVGDLLRMLRQGEGATRSAALRALRRLTGRRLSASPMRCRLWWNSTGPGLKTSVERALNDTERHLKSGRCTKTLRATIAREGWTALGTVLETARRWLLSGNHQLRAEALHAIATLRLGDAADEVAQALEFVNSDDAPAAIGAAFALGIPVPAGAAEYAGLKAGVEPQCPVNQGHGSR